MSLENPQDTLDTNVGDIPEALVDEAEDFPDTFSTMPEGEGLPAEAEPTPTDPGELAPAGAQEGEKKFTITNIEFDNKEFPESTIVYTEGGDAYAIRKNEDGTIEGNQITILDDGSFGPTYQMRQEDFDKPELRAIADAAIEALEGRESVEAGKVLGELFKVATRDGFDPFYGRVPEEVEALASKLDTMLETLDPQKLAQQFFDATIGQDISNNKAAYKVYKLMKGTPFADAFKELESARLVQAGFSEFNL